MPPAADLAEGREVPAVRHAIAETVAHGQTRGSLSPLYLCTSATRCAVATAGRFSVGRRSQPVLLAGLQDKTCALVTKGGTTIG